MLPHHGIWQRLDPSMESVGLAPQPEVGSFALNQVGGVCNIYGSQGMDNRLALGAVCGKPSCCSLMQAWYQFRLGRL